MRSITLLQSFSSSCFPDSVGGVATRFLRPVGVPPSLVSIPVHRSPGILMSLAMQSSHLRHCLHLLFHLFSWCTHAIIDRRSSFIMRLPLHPTTSHQIFLNMHLLHCTNYPPVNSFNSANSPNSVLLKHLQKLMCFNNTLKLLQ